MHVVEAGQLQSTPQHSQPEEGLATHPYGSPPRRVRIQPVATSQPVPQPVVGMDVRLAMRTRHGTVSFSLCLRPGARPHSAHVARRRHLRRGSGGEAEGTAVGGVDVRPQEYITFGKAV